MASHGSTVMASVRRVVGRSWAAIRSKYTQRKKAIPIRLQRSRESSLAMTIRVDETSIPKTFQRGSASSNTTRALARETCWACARPADCDVGPLPWCDSLVTTRSSRSIIGNTEHSSSATTTTHSIACKLDCTRSTRASRTHGRQTSPPKTPRFIATPSNERSLRSPEASSIKSTSREGGRRASKATRSRSLSRCARRAQCHSARISSAMEIACSRARWSAFYVGMRRAASSKHAPSRAPSRGAEAMIGPKPTRCAPMKKSAPSTR